MCQLVSEQTSTISSLTHFVQEGLEPPFWTVADNVLGKHVGTLVRFVCPMVRLFHPPSAVLAIVVRNDGVQEVAPLCLGSVAESEGGALARIERT